MAGELVEAGHISWRRKLGFSVVAVILGSVTIAMFVTSLAVSLCLGRGGCR
jgi:hypothetical protein